MQRYDIINKYIEKYNYTTYVEIGTQNNKSFDKVDINKIGVDPDPRTGADFIMTSDVFFEQLSKDVKHDIFFLDGLHESPQLYKDIKNALDHLSDNGTIVCHDCNPILETEQQVPRISKRWNGDVWKDIVKIRSYREDIEVFTVDTDEGCAVIRKGKSARLEIKDKLTYQNLEKNRKEWLNLITVNEWLEHMGENMSYKIREFIPYSLIKDYGMACNECFFDLDDNDWGIIRDTDCLSLTPSHIHMVKKAIDMHPDTGMFIATTNRVGQKKQVHDMSLFENLDAKVHRKIALELVSKPLTFTEFNIPISGYFMCIKKSVLKEVGGFKSGILGVDTNISNKIRRSGRKILMIDNLYMFHYYRALEGTQYKDHIL